RADVFEHQNLSQIRARVVADAGRRAAADDIDFVLFVNHQARMCGEVDLHLGDAEQVGGGDGGRRRAQVGASAEREDAEVAGADAGAVGEAVGRGRPVRSEDRQARVTGGGA